MDIKFTRLLMSAAATVLFCSCGQHYDVSGVWEKGEGNTVFLYEETEIADSLVLLDSAAVAPDGSFAMKGSIEYPKKVIFSYNGKKKPVFAGDVPVTVSISQRDTLTDKDGNPLYDCEILAGKEQRVLEEGESFELSNALLELGSMMMLSKAYETENQPYIDSVSLGIQMMKDNFNKSIQEYLDTTRENVAVTYFISKFMLKNRSVSEVKASYDSLSAAVKATPQGKDLLSKIEYASKMTIGGIPDDFELPAPDGTMFSLSQLRGHYVILDFWASWCSPCMAEMPNVKAIYAKHHGDGLEILGVSMDDKAENWKKAIEENDLAWHHVSSLQGWDCPVARQFNVTGIPRMFILDPAGRIIAQDLRGEELASTIDSLYAK